MAPSLVRNTKKRRHAAPLLHLRLFRIVDGAAFADDNHFNLAGILHFILDLLGNVMRQNNGSSFIDHLGNNHDANLATRLHGVRTLNALMGIRNFLELLKTLYVTFEAFFASAGTGGGNGVGGLNRDIEQRYSARHRHGAPQSRERFRAFHRSDEQGRHR